ncbi:DUF58 domain-containing protein [Reichenbachiella sp. 5M10]|uniref:DUF58 domain-containing protein n=1 Tax=Reichenbachiella sp. 5M10 TaxID=1889772 RepID=UPI0013045726|nr:DUF58 domain-containing protein [Reichenbachiella sp. 5M10]
MLKNIYLSSRFYYLGMALTLLAMVGFIWSPAYGAFVVLSWVFVLMIGVDFLWLFVSKRTVVARRITSPVYSLGYPNEVKIYVRSNFATPVSVTVIDEAPIDFQERHLFFELPGLGQEEKIISYTLQPTNRGSYAFGQINMLTSTRLGLIRRRFVQPEPETIKVYPSVKHMRETEFLLLSNHSKGLKKLRRPGFNFEFEEIKDYVTGDDIRKINWKATARKNQLMINVYQEEKSQPVYCVINKGRTMQMPFGGLSLLDYSINSALALSNVSLRKGDKAGLITFEKTTQTFLAADNRSFQLKTILECLYNERTAFEEPNYFDLYTTIKRKVTQRSLLLFYTNFETESSLTHQLELIRRLNQAHLVVVVMFENSELKDYIQQAPDTLLDVYQLGIAEKFDLEKRLILKRFRAHGVQALLTNPQNLTIDVINKYLELKGRGLI